MAVTVGPVINDQDIDVVTQWLQDGRLDPASLPARLLPALPRRLHPRTGVDERLPSARTPEADDH